MENKYTDKLLYRFVIIGFSIVFCLFVVFLIFIVLLLPVEHRVIVAIISIILCVIVILCGLISAIKLSDNEENTSRSLEQWKNKLNINIKQPDNEQHLGKISDIMQIGQEAINELKNKKFVEHLEWTIALDKIRTAALTLRSIFISNNNLRNNQAIVSRVELIINTLEQESHNYKKGYIVESHIIMNIGRIGIMTNIISDISITILKIKQKILIETGNTQLTLESELERKTEDILSECQALLNILESIDYFDKNNISIVSNYSSN